MPRIPGLTRILPLTLTLTAIFGFAAIATIAPVAPTHGQPTGKVADCRVGSGGKVVFAGKCRFVPDGPRGSFALSSVRGDVPLYGSILVVTVTILQPGVAEVRGLTRAGVNSRWGEARRSTRDRACWVGSDFRVCAW